MPNVLRSRELRALWLMHAVLVMGLAGCLPERTEGAAPQGLQAGPAPSTDPGSAECCPNSLGGPNCECGDVLESAQAAATIGPEGGSVVLSDSVTLEVPPGALDSAVDIMLSGPIAAPTLGDPSFESVSEMYLFEPHGLTFLVPALATLPASGDVNTILRYQNATDTNPVPVDAAWFDGDAPVARFELTGFSGFSGAKQVRPGQGFEIDPEICEIHGNFEPGANASAVTHYLCEGRDNLHRLTGIWPDDLSIEQFAAEVGHGIVDLSLDADSPGCAVNYAWVDDVFVGRIPKQDPLITCYGSCGLPCLTQLTLVLPPGQHSLRIESYGDPFCTEHFNQGPPVCGEGFDGSGSLKAVLDTTLYVFAGDCTTQTLTLNQLYADCAQLGGNSPDEAPECPAPTEVCPRSDPCHRCCEEACYDGDELVDYRCARDGDDCTIEVYDENGELEHRFTQTVLAWPPPNEHACDVVFVDVSETYYTTGCAGRVANRTTYSEPRFIPGPGWVTDRSYEQYCCIQESPDSPVIRFYDVIWTEETQVIDCGDCWPKWRTPHIEVLPNECEREPYFCEEELTCEDTEPCQYP